MSKYTSDTTVYFIGNPDKPEVASQLAELEKFAAAHCQSVGSTLAFDGCGAIDAQASRVVVIGGDGTLIGVARSLGERQIPIIGVNVGKLGFLTAFSPDDLRANFTRAVSDDSLISRRAMLRVEVKRNNQTHDSLLAVNDCVISAGPPFRIISLGVSIDGEHLTNVRGDGLIVCTPSGSTAHNLSAGGPIMQPGVDAIGLTPLNPHSLTHKPLVVERDSVIVIEADEVNEGTTAIVDGQASCPLAAGDSVTVRRFESDFLLVRNPDVAPWHKLVTKMHWGQQPTFG